MACSCAFPPSASWLDGKTVLGRFGRVEDLMGPVLSLASDASAFITGTSAAGGWWMDCPVRPRTRPPGDLGNAQQGEDETMTELMGLGALVNWGGIVAEQEDD